MPVSDALVVVNDWVSEFYFTSDESSGTFLAAVKSAVKQWETDEADDPQHSSPLSRVTGERQRLLSQLIALHSQANELGDQVRPARRREALGAASEDAAAAWRTVLGYDDLPQTGTAPLRRFTPGGMQEPWVAVVDAVAADTAEELTSKTTGLLTKPYQPEDADGQPDGDPVTTVPGVLSALASEPVPPRLMLVLAGRLALLTSEEGWPQGRYLAIDLQTVAERNDTKVGGELSRAVVALAADSVAPDAQGGLWWEQRQEESVRNAAGVSQDLRDGVRESIEIIANEVVRRRREKGLDPLPDDQAQVLAVQSLRYLYRILFLLYAEASPGLRILPAGDPDYTAGYSVDRLRDLTETPLTTRSERGTHFYDSFQVLFRLAQSGHHPPFDSRGTQLREGLCFEGLSSDLFQARRTSLIDEVGLGNGALQEVLQRLLLTKERKGRKRGFISYVALGINQLGAVYESLMSYSGSFAHGTLVEVARHGNPSDGSWVIPEEQLDDEITPHLVMKSNGDGPDVPRTYKHGEFVFRLSGRQRQTSASYYSPQVLTEFTVEQGLEELLEQGISAQEILELSVCEPALGSGAFAIEAVRQLAKAYLGKRQEELGERIDPEQYQAELQRTKAHIALHNVYGVDLNPTAVELAEVSLWLDTMVADMKAPWFGLRLRSGNSLVGARHAVYDREMVRKATPKTRMTTAPREIPLTRSVDGTSHIFHFLLPGEGWGAAGSATEIKTLAPQEAKALREWAKQVQKKPTPAQLKQLTALTERIDYLWGLAERRMVVAEEQSRRAVSVWGADPAPGGEVTREEIEKSLNTPGSAYQRLRLVMDAWCALWFWPVGQDDMDNDIPAPPSTDEWLAAIQDLVGSTMKTAKAAAQASMELGQLEWGDLDARESWFGTEGALPVERVLEQHPWLRTVRAIAKEQRFFHWELDFAAVFARGGFKFQVGNPPWVQPKVDLDAIKADIDPRGHLVSGGNKELASGPSRADSKYILDQITTSHANAGFIRSSANYPELEGVSRTDLYQAFISISWRHASSRGIVGLIHPHNHMVDGSSAEIRSTSYSKLRRLWSFSNQKKLFEEVGNTRVYSVNIYGPFGDVNFLHAFDLYHPSTVYGSLAHDGTGPFPRRKDPEGGFNTAPHSSRIKRIRYSDLKAWRTLNSALGEDSDVLKTRLLEIFHPVTSQSVHNLFENASKNRSDLEFYAGLDRDIAIRTGRAIDAYDEAPTWSQTIIHPANIATHNALHQRGGNKTRSHRDWVRVDLESIRSDTCPTPRYILSEPPVNVDEFDSPNTNFDPRLTYRIAWGEYVDTATARTLSPAIIPPNTEHFRDVHSMGVMDSCYSQIVLKQAVLGSLLIDAAVRNLIGKHIPDRLLGSLPEIPEDSPVALPAIIRVLRLNCITEEFRHLWNDCFRKDFADETWVSGRPRTNRPNLANGNREWTNLTPLRLPEDRRQAEIEIEALVAHALGIPIDDLCAIYRSEFGVLYKYDNGQDKGAMVYDAHGRLIPTSVRTAWNKAGRPEHGLPDDKRTYTTDSGRTLVAKEPFRILDREADLREAYAAFAERLSGASGTGTKD